MKLRRLGLLVFVASALLQAPLFGGLQQPRAQQSAQSDEKPLAKTVTIDPESLPVSIERIQQAVANTPMLRFDESDRPVQRHRSPSRSSSTGSTRTLSSRLRR